MYTIVDLCILCLTNNKSIKNILSEDGDGVLIEEKLKYFLFEFENIDPEISKHICLHCLKNLNQVYNFKQLCLQNIVKLNHYIHTLKTTEKSCRNLQVIHDIKNSEENQVDIKNDSHAEPTMPENFNFENVILKTDPAKNETGKEYVLQSEYRQETEVDEEELRKGNNIVESKYNENIVIVRINPSDQDNEVDYVLQEEHMQNTTVEEEILRKEDNIVNKGYESISDNDDNNAENETVFRKEVGSMILDDELKNEIVDSIVKEEPEDICDETDIKLEFSDDSKDQLQNEATINAVFIPEFESTYHNSNLTKKEMSDADESVTFTPPELREHVKNVSSELLPEKSKARYQRYYQVFVRWCNEKKVYNYTESVLLAYFAELVSQNKKSLWAIYSMLKSCIIIYKNTDISKYPKLLAYLKRKTANLKPKTSKILEEENINSFIDQAPDSEFLMMKVVLIIGVSGALRREELYNMVVKNVELTNDIIIVNIPEAKTNICRQFVITNSKWIALVKNYLEIRLANSKIKDRFFLTYQNGRCVSSPVGINTIGCIPSKIANFLNLDNCREYTGHCFRRSSVTLLANRGGDLLTLKRHGACKSATVTEGYVENSLKRKIDVAQMRTESGSSTSKKPNTETNTSTQIKYISTSRKKPKSTNERPHKCNQCHKSFKWHEQLIQHKCKCETCEKVFKDPSSLARHKILHTGVKAYKCDMCNKAFALPSSLRMHKRIHTGEKPYKCDVCNKVFNQLSNLRSHKLTHTGIKAYKCDLCDKAFAVSNHLTVHKLKHTGEKSFKCDVCDKAFAQPHPLIVHKRIHTGEKPFKCDVCNKVFNQLSNLRSHKLTHTGIKAYKCDLCDKAFAVSNHLTVHKLKHTGEKSFKCDVCDKAFAQPHPLIVHKRIHTGEKPFKCDECDKAFTQLGQLKTHKLTHRHIGEKPYKCDVCEKTFNQHSLLARHRATHTGVKAFKCDVCNKAYTRSDSLFAHKFIHTGAKAYTCELCDKTFKYAHKLKMHKLTHIDGVNAYKCDKCDKSFKLRNYLIAHKRTHNAVRSFKCDMCDKSYFYLGNLKTHKLTHTGIKKHKCDLCNKAFLVMGQLRKHIRTHNGERPHECDVCGKAYREANKLKKHKLTHVGDKL